MHISEMKLYDYLEQCLVNPTNIKLKQYILQKSCMEHMHFQEKAKSLNKFSSLTKIYLSPLIFHRHPNFDDGAFTEKLHRKLTSTRPVSIFIGAPNFYHFCF